MLATSMGGWHSRAEPRFRVSLGGIGEGRHSDGECPGWLGVSPGSSAAGRVVLRGDSYEFSMENGEIPRRVQYSTCYSHGRENLLHRKPGAVIRRSWLLCMSLHIRECGGRSILSRNCPVLCRLFDLPRRALACSLSCRSLRSCGVRKSPAGDAHSSHHAHTSLSVHFIASAGSKQL